MLKGAIYTKGVVVVRELCGGGGGGGLWVLGDGARMVLRCAGSAMELSSEPSWSDAGGVLRPLVASGIAWRGNPLAVLTSMTRMVPTWLLR